MNVNSVLKILHPFCAMNMEERSRSIPSKEFLLTKSAFSLVQEKDGSWNQTLVKKELMRISRLRCSSCKLLKKQSKGAGAGCAYKKCSHNFHFRCIPIFLKAKNEEGEDLYLAFCSFNCEGLYFKKSTNVLLLEDKRHERPCYLKLFLAKRGKALTEKQETGLKRKCGVTINCKIDSDNSEDYSDNTENENEISKKSTNENSRGSSSFVSCNKPFMVEDEQKEKNQRICKKESATMSDVANTLKTSFNHPATCDKEQDMITATNVDPEIIVIEDSESDDEAEILISKSSNHRLEGEIQGGFIFPPSMMENKEGFQIHHFDARVEAADLFQVIVKESLKSGKRFHLIESNEADTSSVPLSAFNILLSKLRSGTIDQSNSDCFAVHYLRPPEVHHSGYFMKQLQRKILDLSTNLEEVVNNSTDPGKETTFCIVPLFAEGKPLMQPRDNSIHPFAIVHNISIVWIISMVLELVIC